MSGSFFASLIWPIRYILNLLVVTDTFVALRSEFRNVGFMMRKVSEKVPTTVSLGACPTLGKFPLEAQLAASDARYCLLMA